MVSKKETTDNAVESPEIALFIIFEKEQDRYGRDITAMSKFFDDYVQQMHLESRASEVTDGLYPCMACSLRGNGVHQSKIFQSWDEI